MECSNQILARANNSYLILLKHDKTDLSVIKAPKNMYLCTYFIKHIMKRILFVVLLFAVQLSFAQTEKTNVQKAKDYLNKKQDRIVVNFNLENVFHQQTNGFKTKWSSRGLDIYFMYDMPIKKSFVSFAPGIGFSTVNLYHNSKMNIDSTSGRAYFTPYTDTKIKSDFKNIKFSETFIDVPLELRFRTKPLAFDMRFKVAIGMKFGLRIEAFTKERRKDLSVDGAYQKYVERGYKNQIQAFRFGPTLRIGYGPVNLNFYYNALNLFKNGKGPDMHQFSAGISINGL